MSELIKLAEEGKYHQLSQEILKEIETLSGEDLKKIYETILLPNYYNIHPNTFSEITASISKKLSNEDALSLLENTLSLLISLFSIDKSVSSDSLSSNNITTALKLAKNNNSIIRILLEIAYIKILKREIEESKIILYDCKELQIEKKESLKKLHLSLGLLHYLSNNYTPAYKNLLEYLKLNSSDEEILKKCLISGILSDSVHSFTSLIEVFKGSESECKSILLAKALENGNSAEAGKLVSVLRDALNDNANSGNNSVNVLTIENLKEKVEEKCLLIRLLNYFFSQQTRSVYLQSTAEVLGLNISVVEEKVLKILGTGLMRGIIDGITGEFTYTWIGYKHLTGEEITSIRSVISEIRARVDGVRMEIEQNS